MLKQMTFDTNCNGLRIQYWKVSKGKQKKSLFIFEPWRNKKGHGIQVNFSYKEKMRTLLTTWIRLLENGIKLDQSTSWENSSLDWHLKAYFRNNRSEINFVGFIRSPMLV